MTVQQAPKLQRRRLNFLNLLESKFGKAHIVAVVVSHAHIDHYGGIGGLIDEKDVADSSLPLDEQIKSGKTLIIVPEGYEKAVMEENVFAGNAMKRRTNFQYGSLLDKGGKGSLSVGICLTPSSGTTTYISPSYEVKKATETIKVDGVEMVFQLTPDTESPAEMNTCLPKYKALWMAENCSGTMHNLYTLAQCTTSTHSEAQRFVTAMRGRSTLWRQRSFSEIKPK